jgi:hypothetical protein
LAPPRWYKKALQVTPARRLLKLAVPLGQSRAAMIAAAERL